MMFKGSLAIASLCIAALVSGCPQGETPLPPFDATGGFGGVFEAASAAAPEELLTCRIAFDLQHDMDTFFPLNFRLDGTAALNFTCASTLNALADLDMPGLLGIEIGGALVQDDSLSMLGAAEREGRTYGIVLDGTGSDEDGDGVMDVIEGNFTFVVFGESAASLELFQMEGTFTAAAPEDAALLPSVSLRSVSP